MEKIEISRVMKRDAYRYLDYCTFTEWDRLKSLVGFNSKGNYNKLIIHKTNGYYTLLQDYHWILKTTNFKFFEKCVKYKLGGNKHDNR